MVRIEKIAYQKLINNSTLKRARTLSTPSKWYRVNALDHTQKYAYEFFTNTILGRILKPVLDKWFYFQRDYSQDILLQQGLTFEDKFLHHDAQLRRNVLHEHMFRESLHPYHWILKKQRRARYFKVERALRGFFVPEYIRSEAKTQTYLDYDRLFRQWTTFTFNNYFSQITPYPRKSAITLKSPLDYIMIYGSWKQEAYERYFHNGRDEGWFTPKDVQVVQDPKRFPYNLTTAEGKKKFQRQITELNEKHPGMYAPQGQKFDFKKHYAEIGV